MSTLDGSAQSTLTTFLAQRTALAEDEVIWHGGGMRLRVGCYMGEGIPPLEYITSVRSIVLRSGEVLVTRNPDETHIMPGGRREDGETLEETLRREMLEETGWEIEPVAVLGFLHFHHLTPRPPGHPYPYPDFIQLLYASIATVERPDARLPDDYEHEYTFRSVEEMCGPAASKIGGNQVLYLRAAVSALRRFAASPERSE